MQILLWEYGSNPAYKGCWKWRGDEVYYVSNVDLFLKKAIQFKQ